MKKILFILSVLVATLILTGCPPTTGPVEARPLVEEFTMIGFSTDYEFLNGAWFGTSYNSQDALDATVQATLEGSDPNFLGDGKLTGDGFIDLPSLSEGTAYKSFGPTVQFEEVISEMNNKDFQYIIRFYETRGEDNKDHLHVFRLFEGDLQEVIFSKQQF